LPYYSWFVPEETGNGLWLYANRFQNGAMLQTESLISFQRLSSKIAENLDCYVHMNIIIIWDYLQLWSNQRKKRWAEIASQRDQQTSYQLGKESRDRWLQFLCRRGQ
jgi:hypothetical protein